MTINKAMERASRLRSDPYDDETKAGWLLELEGRIREEVVKAHEGAVAGEPVRAFPEDLHNGEADRYANSARVFNSALDAWAQAYPRRHRPVPARYPRNVF